MCTMSWQIYEDSLSVIFNRDELLSRKDGLPPDNFLSNGVRYIAPKDPEGGGTWVSANENGLILALLNNYNVASKPDSNVQYKSRGQIVAMLSSLTSLDEVSKSLNSTNLSDYRPFDIYAFAGVRGPQQWSWDGNSLIHHASPDVPAVSSSVHFPHIKNYRKHLFDTLTSNGTKNISPDEQLAFHRSRSPGKESYSTAMKRSDRATVSITQIQLTNDSVNMRYLDGDVTNSDKSFSTVELPLKSIRRKRPD